MFFKVFLTGTKHSYEILKLKKHLKKKIYSVNLLWNKQELINLKSKLKNNEQKLEI